MPISLAAGPRATPCIHPRTLHKVPAVGCQGPAPQVTILDITEHLPHTLINLERGKPGGAR